MDRVTKTDAEVREDLAKWMLERKHLRWLFEMLPPTCEVRGSVPLRCPGPGEIGEVVSYTSDGLVSVVCEGNRFRAFCKPNDLQVVKYTRGMTPEWVRAVFEVKN